MSALFYGSLNATTPSSSSGSTHFTRASKYSTPPLRDVGIPNGCLAHAAGASVVEDAGRICISIGTPRFDDAELRQLAERKGSAAAWLRIWAQNGDAAPDGVKGRFAVLVLDPAANFAWMATDRFATWPICHASVGTTLHFSDRADQVPGGRYAVSSQSIFEYLYFHMIPAPATVFADVFRLPAGHLLRWDNGATTIVPYWKPRFVEDRTPPLEEAKQTFLDIVEQAVAREAEGHNVGAYLSGGTDSSTVSGMLGKVLGRPARSYSIGFDAQGYDEMEYARIAARHFGCEHHEYYVRAEDLLDGIPRVAKHYDQPFGNSSAVPAWICASRAREEGIDKLLAGDGGDELFGGNTRYAKQRVFSWYDSVPGLVRRGLLEPALTLRGLGRIPIAKKAVSYVEQARVPMPDRVQMYNMLLRLGMHEIFTDAFLDQVDVDRPARRQRETWARADSQNLVNRMLAFDWKYTLADNDLPKVIGTTNLAGVEVGFPLLSDELLEFSLSIPPDWKLKGLTLRWFFKEALRGFLPREIIAKKKHGFGLPFGLWVCEHPGLKALAADALGHFKTRGIVRAAFIDRLLDTHLPAHPNYYGEMVWILMMLEFWMREHVDAPRPDVLPGEKTSIATSESN